MTEPKSLLHLVRWFRAEWQAEMGSGRIHVRDTDAGGDPEWHARFKAIVEIPVKQGDPLEWVGSQAPHLPMRFYLWKMAKGSERGRRRARFLFRLACTDFDWLETARRTSNLAKSMDEHGVDWAEDYAETCLRRLWAMYADPERTEADQHGRPVGPRTFVQKRIGKSEAQSAAESAA